jgi:hypothetical protein
MATRTAAMEIVAKAATAVRAPEKATAAKEIVGRVTLRTDAFEEFAHGCGLAQSGDWKIQAWTWTSPRGKSGKK